MVFAGQTEFLVWLTLLEGNLQVIISEIYARDSSQPEGNVTPLSTKLFVNFHKINQSEDSQSIQPPQT